MLFILTYPIVHDYCENKRNFFLNLSFSHIFQKLYCINFSACIFFLFVLE